MRACIRYGPLLEACRRTGDRKRARRIGKEMLLGGGPYSNFCMTSLRRALGIAQLRTLCRECNVPWEDDSGGRGGGDRGGGSAPGGGASGGPRGSGGRGRGRGGRGRGRGEGRG